MIQRSRNETYDKQSFYSRNVNEKGHETPHNVELGQAGESRSILQHTPSNAMPPIKKREEKKTTPRKIR